MQSHAIGFVSHSLSHETQIAYKCVLLSGKHGIRMNTSSRVTSSKRNPAGHPSKSHTQFWIPLAQGEPLQPGPFDRLESLMNQITLPSLFLLLCYLCLTAALPAFPLSNLTNSVGGDVFVTNCNVVPHPPRAIEQADCFDAIDRFQKRVDPGPTETDVICTYDVAKAHDPSFIVLPDSETFRSCEVAWDIPHRMDVAVSWDGFFWFSRDLVHECVGGDKNGGVNEWGRDWGHILQFKIGLPNLVGKVQIGNGTMSGSVDVD